MIVVLEDMIAVLEDMIVVLRSEWSDQNENPT